VARIKRAVHAKKKKKAYFKAAKGYRGGRSRLWRTVKDAVERSREYAYRDRKVRKRDYRQLWVTRINAAARENGLSYSEFIFLLKKANIDLDRKALAAIAYENPEKFKQIVEIAKASKTEAA
jgi:large subunit ribosomal protein L20